MKGPRDAHAQRQPAGGHLASWYMPGRADGFGDRLVMFDNTDTPPLELLRFRGELTAQPGFEEQLRDRVRTLQGLHHPAFAPVRSVQRLDEDDALTLVSVHMQGLRLSELFERGARSGLDAGIVAWLIRELTPALAALEAHGPDIAHGALTPDRIVLTPEGRLRIVEHVLGGALQGLHLDRESLWREFGVLAPGAADGPARLDARTDLIQLGSLALSMLVGRPLTPGEVDGQVPALLDDVDTRATPDGAGQLPPLRAWLERALRPDGRGYRSASDAAADLRELRPAARSRVAVRALPEAEVSDDGSMAAAAALPAISTLRPVPYFQEPRTMRQYPDIPDIGDSFPSESPVGPASSREPASDPDDQIRALRARLNQATPPASEPRPVHREARFPAAGIGRAAPVDEDVEPEYRPPGRASGLHGLVARPRLPHTVSARVAAALAAIVLGEAAAIAYLITRTSAAPAAATLVIESPQAGDQVLVNGQAVGATPYQLTIGSDTTSVRVVSPGPVFEGAAAATSSRPAAAQPVSSPRAAAEIPAAAPSRQGGLRLVAPIELTVVQGDRVLGSTAEGPIYLSAGTHQVQLVNNALGFRANQSITVRAGQVGTQRIDVPNGRLNLNAQPWARVFVDGTLVGETPLANIEVPIGDHEVVFRHPELGDRRERVTVRADSVVRVTANFN